MIESEDLYAIWDGFSRGLINRAQTIILVGAAVRSEEWTVSGFKKSFGADYKYCKEHKLVWEHTDSESKKHFVRLSPDISSRLESLELNNNSPDTTLTSNTSTSNKKKIGQKNTQKGSSGTKNSKNDERAQRMKEIEGDPTFIKVHGILSDYFKENSISAWRISQGNKANPYAHYQRMCELEEYGIDWADFAQWYRDEGPFASKGFLWPLFMHYDVVANYESAKEGREYSKSKKDRYLKTTTNLQNDEEFKRQAKEFRDRFSGDSEDDE